MEHTSLSDALISLIPTYGPWIIFGIVSLESAGVPLPGETILVAAALLAATTGQISKTDPIASRRPGEGTARCVRTANAIVTPNQTPPFMRRNEVTLRRRAELALSDHSRV